VDSRQANTADFTKFHVHAPQDILVNQDAAQRGLVSLVRSRQEGSRMVSVQGGKDHHQVHIHSLDWFKCKPCRDTRIDVPGMGSNYTQDMSFQRGRVCFLQVCIHLFCQAGWITIIPGASNGGGTQVDGSHSAPSASGNSRD